MASGKDLKKVIKELESEGWSASIGGKHRRISHPKYGNVYCSITPSCQFVHKKVRRDADRLKEKYEKENKK